jgi:HAD superfamily hydrolase (TIGR01662 family)
MTAKIKAIFLDSGNTLRVLVKDADFQSQARQQLARLVGTRESPDDFSEQLNTRYDMYKKRATGTLLQASAIEIWTRWMLPDHPADQIAPLADQLTTLWRNARGRHVPRPEAKPTIIELDNRGYLLGIITNTISETEIPAWLEADGLTQYFKAVILSSKFGRRKPDPYIYSEASYVAGVSPANCAYVGDNPNVDIMGAYQAGFGMVIILAQPAATGKEIPAGQRKPDLVIHEIKDLLDIFPPLQNNKA